MKLKDLEAFRAVMDSGSTQGAAQYLGISQSAVSRRLTQLEEYLDLQLFVRDRARLIPADGSKELERLAGDVLERAFLLDEVAKAMRRGERTRALITISVPSSITRTTLPRLIAEFCAENPGFRFDVTCGPYDATERMLRDGRVDIGLLRLPFSEPGFQLGGVIAAPSVCILPKGHPLTVLSEIRVQNLSGVPLVLLGWRRAPRRDVDLAFQTAGIVQDIVAEAHSVSTACGLVAAGLGVSIVNGLLMRECADLDIEVRPFVPTLPNRLSFVQPLGPKASEGAAAFVRFATGRLQIMASEPMVK
ncbi:LysR family transcriptional regulator [Falsirhodobacter halotolerans]|uniref:LysR family transcriptional regulator n=1 Tax=Falsirhodobacter halotolerans TaxID=1146892 RepID=UPI001FD26FF2|nr:LysR family transcriptional regulator [Falsirhodobacter halotolerans]MCJ8140103.1 LysR family transcriptional regulator [Falsirhodobacter halotolerans]